MTLGPQDDDERTGSDQDEPVRRSSFSAPVSWDPTEFADRPDFSWKPAGPQDEGSDIAPEERPDFSWKPAGRPAPAADDSDRLESSTSDSQQAIPQSQRAELFESLQGPTVRELAEAKQKKRKLVGTISGVAILLVVLLGVVALVIAQRSGGNDSDTDNSAAAAVPSETGGASASAANSASQAPAAAAPAACPPGTRNDPGSTASGPDAIAAMEYAYYVDRSGAKVRELYSPTTDLAVDRVQSAINALAPGTKHCLMIKELQPGQYSLAIYEIPPGGAVPPQPTYESKVITDVVEGKTLIRSLN